MNINSRAAHRRSKASLAAAIVTLVVWSGVAHAQQFVNPGFETGDFTGWMIEPTSPNGQTWVQLVELVDIDGPGPLEPSLAARFSVGGINTPVTRDGIELTQMLQLSAGVEYTFSFNWATTHPSGDNSDGGAFTLIINGDPIGDTVFAGQTSSTVSKYGFIIRQYTPTTSGAHRVGVRITRQFRVTAVFGNSLSQWVDNFLVEGGTAPCYANCDSSTTPPILNVEDFTCFINEFAAAQSLPHEQQLTHYANCDQSTTPPVLNVEDFTCFINAFAQGCP
jgi:hypothetical protein